MKRRTLLTGGLPVAAVASSNFASAAQGASYDVAVVGAGVFGAWTAHHLHKAGRRVILIDAYGPSSSRASSGGESRIIRCAYGPDEIYTRFAWQSLRQWKDLGARLKTTTFEQCGVLLLANNADAGAKAALQVLPKVGVPFERLDREALRKRFPQFQTDDVDYGLFEPQCGGLMARRSVQLLVRELADSGVPLVLEPVLPPGGGKRTLDTVKTASGQTISAGTFVFACGPWLPKVFPAELGNRIFPTRQEIFFFGPPAGDLRFAPPAMPCWIDGDRFYGLPSFENRGFKFADDGHGAPADPDAMDRVVRLDSLEEIRKQLSKRFPAMKNAPLIESRVCQYENSSNGDFLLDRHPGIDNVWLAGGGSGHGFKHGPAVGEYLAGRILSPGNTTAEPRFSFASKATVQKRAVF